MADSNQQTPEEQAAQAELRKNLLSMAQDMKLVLEEMRIAEVDIKSSAAADADCCCCCTPASSCCGAASVPEH